MQMYLQKPPQNKRRTKSIVYSNQLSTRFRGALLLNSHKSWWLLLLLLPLSLLEFSCIVSIPCNKPNGKKLWVLKLWVLWAHSPIHNNKWQKYLGTIRQLPIPSENFNNTKLKKNKISMTLQQIVAPTEHANATIEAPKLHLLLSNLVGLWISNTII